jgi:SAM-dependent methyltransferase
MNLKEEWNKRAKEDAFRYVSCFRKDWSDESFYAWGEIQTHIVIDKFFQTQNIDPSGWAVLEIGCGAGRMSRALSSRFKCVLAYDVSEKYIQIAREKNSHLKNVVFTVNDGTSFPEVSDGSIDFVFSGWTMQHMPTQAVVFKNIAEIGRVLKAGGLYKVDPVLRTHSKTVETIISKVVGSRIPKFWAPLFGIDKLVVTPTWRGARFAEEELFTAFSSNGLTVTTLVEDDGLESFQGKKTMRKWFYGKKTPI